MVADPDLPLIDTLYPGDELGFPNRFWWERDSENTNLYRWSDLSQRLGYLSSEISRVRALVPLIPSANVNHVNQIERSSTSLHVDIVRARARAVCKPKLRVVRCPYEIHTRGYFRIR